MAGFKASNITISCEAKGCIFTGTKLTRATTREIRTCSNPLIKINYENLRRHVITDGHKGGTGWARLHQRQKCLLIVYLHKNVPRRSERGRDKLLQFFKR